MQVRSRQKAWVKCQVQVRVGRVETAGKDD